MSCDLYGAITDNTFYKLKTQFTELLMVHATSYLYDYPNMLGCTERHGICVSQVKCHHLGQVFFFKEHAGCKVHFPSISIKIGHLTRCYERKRVTYQGYLNISF